MKVVASYLTKREAQNVARAFPKSQICIMSSKLSRAITLDEATEKQFWCVQI